MPVAPYGTLKYRAWNRARMQRRRENGHVRRRERLLRSIREADVSIARYEAQLTPHQEGDV